MQIFYEGMDISEWVDVRNCQYTDAAGGRLDSVEIEMENAARWYAWGPKKDERIDVVEGQFTTGPMYIDMILPKDDRITLIATSATSAAHNRAWKSFENKTLGDVLRACAAESGMDSAVFGLDEQTLYPYMMRKNEKVFGFLHRIAELEGGILKCVNGRMTIIGIEYAQEINARQSIEITRDSPGISHQIIDGTRLAGLQIITPYAQGSATDTLSDGVWKEVADAPARDNIQASRWARGLLLTANRKAESLTVPSGLNPGMTAMATVDVDGTVAISGRWMVDAAVHDLIKKTTRTRLVRCITSIR